MFIRGLIIVAAVLSITGCCHQNYNIPSDYMYEAPVQYSYYEQSRIKHQQKYRNNANRPPRQQWDYHL